MIRGKLNIPGPALIAAAAVVLALPGIAAADLYGFTKLTSNSSANVASQLLVDVTDAGGGAVDFLFTNAVGTPSSIAGIFFDDGTLLGISQIFNSAGVSFDDPASSPVLPGGNLASPPFVVTAGFSADSDPPAESNGVNAAGESVTIRFNLQGSQTFADTIAALGDGSLRIGLHVLAQGTDGRSDAYINNPNPVPAPGAVLLGLIGFGMVGWVKRRFA